ncbi:fibronectin type III domain-containing protein [Bifidobacterium sp. 82T24]|uniref:fibronectin type III domain-containing protein n=1 Tax=Bifidobacterium pluvialisilvae TaxID=2834436 RepID=UPI001C570C97|nr:fibronectin type III domain-containing protein [Bifidobacterium pluvialisilvae]MBW3087642.1 fibronectin type III domain-containing protein [Bifidobacterium pluvialisilvae]
MSITRTILKTICAGASIVAVCAGSVAAIAPAFAADGAASSSSAATNVDDAIFEWGVNPETGGGSYFGGCNALSAGTAGDAGGSGVWTANKTGKDGKTLYRTVDETAHAEILKPTSDGTMKRVSGFDARCTNRNGTSIAGKTSGATMNGEATYSENIVRLSGGTGTIDAATNSAHLTWKGASFTIVYYGGMTYWSISDPVLDISNGRGTLTGTASGYAADMNDASKWETLPATTIHLADFTTGTASGADPQITFDGSNGTITAQPDYLGVKADAGANAHAGQADRNAGNAAWWGSFPATWVQFNNATGQSSYWYTTSGGTNTIQPRKVASPITITWKRTPNVTAGAKSVERGGTITFTGNGPADASYAGRVISPAGETVANKLKPTATDPTTWRYDVPADALAGTYTFELYDETAGDDAAAVARTTFVVGRLPGAPTLTSHDNAGTDRVELFWTAPGEKGDPKFSGFVATAKPKSGGESVIASFGRKERSGMITGLKAATTYDVTITATNALGPGAASNAMTITTAAGSSSGGSSSAGGVSGSGSGSSAGGTTYKNVTLRWGINDETNSAAYYGGCNFISAGKAGNTGSSKTWTSSFYRAKDGNVTIEKPDSSGKWVTASWNSRCLTRDGDSVKMAKRVDGRSINTESQVVLSKGSGTVQADGSVEISWTGSFTVAYYGGMTYWSVTDPKLTLDASGNGAITATASGYGADMNDASKWVTLSPRTIHLADFKGVDVKSAASAHGFTKTPEYLGVAVKASGDHGGQAAKDSANAAYWGSFPQSFVDFQLETGQSAYWYTANSQRDYAKPTLPLSVQYDSSFKVSAGAGSAAAATAAGGSSGSSSSGLGGGGALSRGGSSAKSSAAKKSAAAKTDSSKSDDAADPAAASDDAAADSTGAGAAAPLIADNARTIALGSGGVAAAAGLPLGLGWFIRRRLGLDPSAALDSRLGL